MTGLIQTEIIRRVWREIEPQLKEQGYELVEVEYCTENGRWVLRLYVDKPSGITLDDCQSLSHLVGPLLDLGDFIQGQYTLEVSSPGIDRPLRKPEDFTRFAGERVKVVAEMPVAGRRQFKGVLKGFQDGLIQVECGGVLCEVHIENLKKARLDR